jgi:lysophospholipase L1-like esterase
VNAYPTINVQELSMKRLLFVLSLTICFTPAVDAAEPLLQPGDYVAIIGDSITQQKIYSVYIEDYLLMCQPIKNLRITQFGWDGQSANSYSYRMENDTFRFKPTVITTCYGMNDGGYRAMTPEIGEMYRKAQQQIVDMAKNKGVRKIIVGSSGCVDTVQFRAPVHAPAAVYNQTLAALRDIAREVARSSDVVFADVYSPMYDAMVKGKAKYGPEYYVPGHDGFHPNPNGQLVMAYAFLKALGCSGDIGTFTVDMAKNQAEVTEGHKLLACNQGTVELESTRYPFCFFGDPKDPMGTSGMTEFIPFNSELNRLTLIVKDPPAENCKITWGNTSKNFTKAQLTAGINLAAEFIDNPFGEPFRKVEALVRQQQDYETPLVQNLINKLPEFKKMIPDESATLERIAAAAIQKDKELCDQAAAAVTPVRHKILIQAAP